jgi:DNA-binding MarR family transcriptional regulator
MPPMSSTAPRPGAVTDPVAELAGRLRLAVARLARQLRQTAESDLSPTQLATIATLDRTGPVTLSELAALERVAPPSITRAVGRLVEAGLVARQPDPHDGRITRVSLTAAGRALLERNRSRRSAWLATRLRELPPDEVERLAAAAEVLEHLAGLDVAEPGP